MLHNLCSQWVPPCFWPVVRLHKGHMFRQIHNNLIIRCATTRIRKPGKTRVVLLKLQPTVCPLCAGIITRFAWMRCVQGTSDISLNLLHKLAALVYLTAEEDWCLFNNVNLSRVPGDPPAASWVFFFVTEGLSDLFKLSCCCRSFPWLMLMIESVLCEFKCRVRIFAHRVSTFLVWAATSTPRIIHFTSFSLAVKNIFTERSTSAIMEMVYWAASAVFIHVIVDDDMQLPAERVRACVRETQ